MNQPIGGINYAALKPSNSRQSKRLFVHNLPASVTEDAIVQYFNLQMNDLNISEGTDPCVSASISTRRDFALLEFKTPADATLALAFDGTTIDDSEPSADASNGMSNGSGHGLRIRRPKDYIAPTADNSGYQPGVVSTVVPDSANKICVTNIPTYLTDEQVTELLISFGALKSFVLVKDRGTEESRVGNNSFSLQTIITTTKPLTPRELPFFFC
jgi:splicing factor U2AF subunit